MDAKKVKILWISLNAPTVKADKAGGNTFNYYFKKFYSDEQFDVKVIAQINSDRPLMPLKEGGGFYLSRLGGLKDKVKKLSSLESKYNPWNRNANLISNQMESFALSKIQYLLETGFEPDVVILEWTQCVVLAEKIKEVLPKARIVASEHDVTFVGFERKAQHYTGIKKAIWRHRYTWEKKIELKALNICDLVLPQNPDNVELLIQNGIPKEKVQWLSPYLNDMSYIKREPNHRDILFFGAMGRPENSMSATWFIERVMPRIEDLDIRFVILGSNPPEDLIRLESERIHVTGFVDSVDAYFAGSMCMVAPLVLGAGIKVKVLESLSSGIPVLTNEIGIEGIPAMPNLHYFHCETPEEYETVIRKLYERDPDYCGIIGRQFIEETYDLEKSYAQYAEKLIELGGAK